MKYQTANQKQNWSKSQQSKINNEQKLKKWKTDKMAQNFVCHRAIQLTYSQASLNGDSIWRNNWKNNQNERKWNLKNWRTQTKWMKMCLIWIYIYNLLLALFLLIFFSIHFSTFLITKNYSCLSFLCFVALPFFCFAFFLCFFFVFNFSFIMNV